MIEPDPEAVAKIVLGSLLSPSTPECQQIVTMVADWLDSTVDCVKESQ